MSNQSNSRELFLALAKVFREHNKEPMTISDIGFALKAVGINLPEFALRGRLDGLVQFGSLKRKVLRDDPSKTIYWTKQLFDLHDSDEVRNLKMQIAEALNARPTPQQQAALEREIQQLEDNIKEVDQKLAGVRNKDEIQRESASALKIIALEQEINAIMDETNHWKRITEKAIELLHAHNPEASVEQIRAMAYK